MVVSFYNSKGKYNQINGKTDLCRGSQYKTRIFNRPRGIVVQISWTFRLKPSRWEAGEKTFNNKPVPGFKQKPVHERLGSRQYSKQQKE